MARSGGKRSVTRLRERLRQEAGWRVSEGLFRGVSSTARLHPLARPEAHNIEVIRDVPYRRAGVPEHRLDIYRPLRPRRRGDTIVCIKFHCTPMQTNALRVHDGGYHQPRSRRLR